MHGGTGRTIEMKGPWFEPGATALTWEGKDLAEAEPLSELETALLLWAACGPNGIVGGDIGLNENLSTMVCMAGRTIPGPCNDAAVNIIFANDDGTFLYKPTYHRERPVEIETEEDYEKVLTWFREGTIKLSDKRPDIDWTVMPGRPLGIYQINSNKPGSTVFFTHVGGRSWHRLAVPPGAYASAWAFIGPGVAVFVTKSRAFVTTDEGRNWTSLALRNAFYSCTVRRPSHSGIWLTCTDVTSKRPLTMSDSWPVT